ncbi:MAG: type II toxin-antitoxin system RelE/ParE family toxin [Oscillospiraceae bacterium]|jgi:mRNA interferase RelE/StbE|nr:type II toxin-antitoxin system RelE/ParE family toxin [Oscillospiraceae bacterium]
MKVKYSKDALKFLAKLDGKSVTRIRNAVSGLTENPQVGDVTALQGYSDGRKRLRIGSWRIIFKKDAENAVEIIYVIDIGNRGDIYK